MTIGEMISALNLYCVSDDDYLIGRTIYSIEIKNDNEIHIFFADGNTTNVIIDSNGNFISYMEWEE